jgi:hypothetical protein
MSVKSLIAELKSAYTEAGLVCGDGLLPPASKTDLDGMAFELSMSLPRELLEVYAVHGGQEEIPPGVNGLFGWHRLLLPRQVVEIHQVYCEILPGLGCVTWDPLLIPFASFNANELCVHATSGEVWAVTANGGGVRDCHRPSIAVVLSELLEAVRQGEDACLREYRQADE